MSSLAEDQDYLLHLTFTYLFLVHSILKQVLMFLLQSPIIKYLKDSRDIKDYSIGIKIIVLSLPCFVSWNFLCCKAHDFSVFTHAPESPVHLTHDIIEDGGPVTLIIFLHFIQFLK